MSIREHEGKKYLRAVRSAVDGSQIEVDVYAVLVAFNVTCPAASNFFTAWPIAGQRGKGDVVADLTGAKAAIERAIQLKQQRGQ